MSAPTPTSLAPLAMFAYCRPDHFQQTVDAIVANTLAPQTECYVFCDGPRNEQDAAACEQVRQIARQITGFAKVTVTEAERNIGLSPSIIGGIGRVLEQHERVIVIEDDIVCSPHALTYFNAALDHYESEPAVFTVSGYNYPPGMVAMPENYEFDTYFNYRFLCWGWATWRDRWQKIDWQLNSYDAFAASAAKRRSFARAGPDLADQLVAHRAGKISSWDTCLAYEQFRNNGLSLCPIRSFVHNIGHDGTGTHCRHVSNRYDNDLSLAVERPTFPDQVFVDPALSGAIQAAFTPQPRRRFKKLRRLLGLPR